MRRRDFLERTLEGMVLLYSGLLLNTDEKRIDRAANEIVFQSEESNYVNIRRKLTDSGIEIIEDYSKNKESERIVIYLPDLHHPIFTKDQKKRITEIIELFKNESVALGLEGYYQKLTPQSIQEAKVRKETFVGSNQEEAILKTKVKEVGNSFVELIKENPQRKESIIKLLAEFEDISKHVLNTVAQNKGYENQIHSPGSAYLFENYPENIHLFAIESEDIYKQCMQEYAEYDNTLKMEYIEILRIKTAKIVAKYKIEENNKRIKDILSITYVLESMISESCNKFQRCIDYRNSTNKNKFSVDVRDMGRMHLDLDLKRNKTWSENIRVIDEKYKIVIVVGGAAHLKSGIYQEIIKDSSIITINTHIERYNPTF